MKITIIGAGNMGGAIARGLAKGSFFAESEITCTAKGTATLEKLRATNPAMNLNTNNMEAVKGADIVVFAVKPWLIKEVIEQVKPNLVPDSGQIYISVAAGIPCNDLEEMLESYNVIRVIPNTAIEIRESMTFITASDLKLPALEMADKIFAELGNTMTVPESQIAACTALASCGIAFAMRYIHASAQGGVEIGIKAVDAQKIVEHTMIGAAKLLLAKGTHPAVEIDKVTTPGGITIRGLNEMEHAGFTSAVIRGLKECVR